jgi:hypothetical protein
LELAGAVLINPRRFGLQSLKLQILLISSPMGRKSYFSESDVMPLVKRYTSSTLLTLLREIAKCETAKLDWDALVKARQRASAVQESTKLCGGAWRTV